MSETVKFEAGQTLVLQAKMSIIPGSVDNNPAFKRFSRNDGETTLAKEHPVTFVGYQKLVIKGKKKTQPVVTVEVNGTRMQIWAYRDHLEATDKVADPKAQLMILETKRDALQAQLDTVEDQIEQVTAELEAEPEAEPAAEDPSDLSDLGDGTEPEIEGADEGDEDSDELDDDTLE